METLKKTLFVLAFIALLTQTIRHAYYAWLEPRESVLDKYGVPLMEEIKASASIDQLLSKYDDIQQKIKAFEADPANKDIPRHERFDMEPYKSERLLREAVQEWELRSKEIFKIRLYSGAGFVFVILGLVLYKQVNEWLGLTLIITGFAEKIYWTSPSFLGAETMEYGRLLANKFYISLAAFLVLLLVGWVTKTIMRKSQTA